MFKLLSVFKCKNRAVEESDFGRRFGWFIEKDGQVIGDLNYLRWDCDMQFWHEYRVAHPRNSWVTAQRDSSIPVAFSKASPGKKNDFGSDLDLTSKKTALMEAPTGGWPATPAGTCS